MEELPGRLVPQADNFSKVVGTVIAVAAGYNDDVGIASQLEDMDPRQGRYYRLAAEIIGLVVNEQNTAHVTDLGQQLADAKGNEFKDVIRSSLRTNEFLSELLDQMYLSPVGWSRTQLREFIGHRTKLTGSTPGRRSTTVKNWLLESGFVVESGGLMIPVDEFRLAGDALQDEYDELHPNVKEAFVAAQGKLHASEFEPANADEGREHALRSVAVRRGQREFRKQLLELYKGCCAVTGTDLSHALEAAHIMPYSGPSTNHPANGLLLRADIHTLFDLRLIAIESSTMTVVTKQALKGSTYENLKGVTVSVPEDAAMVPSPAALDWHRQDAGL